jgi:mannobiose 2-epimerase
MDVIDIKSFRDKLLTTLTDNILEYWIKNTIDENYGGFAGLVDINNKVDPKANKGIILNARILWTFAATGSFLKDDKYIILADRAYSYIIEKFIDLKHGGVYWELDYKGSVVDRKKQVYAQAFAIYALSEYYKVKKSNEVLKLAKEFFYMLEKYSLDKHDGGYIEAFTEEWKDMDDVRLSIKDRNAKKTMNTHLHVLEAYTNLFRIWPDEQLLNALKNLANIFINHFVNDSGHLNLFFDEKWNKIDNIISFGHDIEFSWLFTEAAEVACDPYLIGISEDIALKMVDAVIKEGFAPDGGIYNEINLNNNHLDTDKHWWPQSEGVVGLVNAYRISSDKSYLERAIRLWEFIDEFIIDHDSGEWYWRVNNKGIPYKNNEKVGFWKCPYHNSRTCIEVINRLP